MTCAIKQCEQLWYARGLRWAENLNIVVDEVHLRDR